MRPDLKGMKGGQKQFWLRVHRSEVEKYYHANGPEATMEEFCMSQATLERFWNRRGQDIQRNKWSQSDKEVYQVLMEGIRVERGRIRKLEEWRADVDPFIQSARSLLAATLGRIEGKVEITSLPCPTPEANNNGRKLEN